MHAAREKTAARLLRLALALLAISLIAAFPVPATSATAPKPDPAPVKPSAPATTSQPPATLTHTAATPTAPSSKAKTKSHKPHRHKPATGSTIPRPVTTTIKSRPVLTPTDSKRPSSTGSQTLKLAALSLVGVGMLLLVLATLEPRYIRPRRLIPIYADHRGDLAIAGAIVLLSVGIAYLSSGL
jgi:uncharacterized membrane protein